PAARRRRARGRRARRGVTASRAPRSGARTRGRTDARRPVVPDETRCLAPCLIGASRRVAASGGGAGAPRLTAGTERTAGRAAAVAGSGAARLTSATLVLVACGRA